MVTADAVASKLSSTIRIADAAVPQSGVLREGSFYFGQGTLGSFWTTLLVGPQRPLPSKRPPPPLRTHGGLHYYSKRTSMFYMIFI